MGEGEPQKLTIRCANDYGSCVLSDLGFGRFGQSEALRQIFRTQLNSAISSAIQTMKACGKSQGVNDIMRLTCPGNCGLKALYDAYSQIDPDDPESFNGFDRTLDLVMSLFNGESLPPPPTYPQLSPGEDEVS